MAMLVQSLGIGLHEIPQQIACLDIHNNQHLTLGFIGSNEGQACRTIAVGDTPNLQRPGQCIERELYISFSGVLSLFDYMNQGYTLDQHFSQWRNNTSL